MKHRARNVIFAIAAAIGFNAQEANAQASRTEPSLPYPLPLYQPPQAQHHKSVPSHDGLKPLFYPVVKPPHRPHGNRVVVIDPCEKHHGHDKRQHKHAHKKRPVHAPLPHGRR